MKKQRDGDYSAGTLLIWVVLASVLPFLVVGSYLLFAYVGAEREAALRRLTVATEALSASVDRELDGHIEKLRVLASSRAVGEGDLKRFAETASAAAVSVEGDFFLADRSGQQLVNTRALAGTTLPSAGDLEAVQRVFATGKSQIGDLVAGTVQARYLFATLIPITVNEEVRYVLGFMPRENNILSMLHEAALPKEWFAAVLDRRGRIIARSSKHEEFYGKLASSDFVARMTGSSGRLESVDLENRDTISAYKLSPRTQWWTVVWVPKPVLQERANTALWALLGLTCITLVTSLSVGYFVAHLIKGPTRQLLIAARSLGAGKQVRFDRALMREANTVGSAMSDASRDIRLYMREISHRSKNLLAVVQAIARQTRRNSHDLGDFAQRFDDRLQSLARSHDLLVERNWSGAFVHDLVRAQLQPFIEDGDARVDISGDPVLLSAGASQHLGLAFHELATNASKYGALSVPSGQLRIDWGKKTNADGNEMFQLSWRESGGPAVSEPMKKGFGGFVIEEAVAIGVSGSAKIDWNPDGLVWTLDAPADRLLSQGPFEITEA
jgi:two-component sensor histidine kinase